MKGKILHKNRIAQAEKKIFPLGNKNLAFLIANQAKTLLSTGF